ncbi:hypothetical protein [Sphingomonas sp.]|uniref:hypothetical protein n=1 Tax=Sphingomonas sp. TaxID=28214 RepID=UPI003B3B3B88
MSLIADRARLTDSSGRRHDILTLMALGCTAYFVAVMGHEILGHGTIMYLSGVRDFVLTSTSIDALPPPPPISNATKAGAAVFMGGSLFNVLLGAGLYLWLQRTRQGSQSPALHFGLRLLAVVNLSLGLIYLSFSGIFGVGDWAELIAGWPDAGLWRVIEIGVGLAGFYLAARLMARWLAEYQGRARRLTWAPYLASVAAFCLIGLRVPDPVIILISVLPAPILGQLALVAAPLLLRPSGQPNPKPAQSIQRSWPAIALAMLCLGATWWIAPGVTIHL